MEKAAELADDLPTDLDCRHEDEKCTLYFLTSKKQWYLMYNVVGVVKSSWRSVLF